MLVDYGDRMDVEEFLIQFQDHLAPRLDTYEQATYLYLRPTHSP